MTVFERIIARAIPADIVFEDDFCISIRDIDPQAPVHLLVIPKKLIPRLGAATKDDESILGHLLLTAAKLARGEGFESTGFRIVINHAADAGESVPHLHVHVLAGHPLVWPPA